MRTGLIHLTGLAATLLLLLTLILWADQMRHSTDLICDAGFAGVHLTSDLAGLHLSLAVGWDPNDSSMEYRFDRTRYPLPPDELRRYLDKQKVPFPLFDAGSHESGMVSILVPHWFAPVLLAPAAILYLRFLLRRHRGYAGGHGRSDIEPDFPATSGSPAGPVDP